MFNTREFEIFSMTTQAKILKLFERTKEIELEQNERILEFGIDTFEIINGRNSFKKDIESLK